MRIELIEQIDTAVADELDSAKKKFPANNSRHEGYAVLLEEFEEMRDEEEILAHELDNIWDATKKNTDPDVLLKYLNRARNISRKLIAEAVQTAAMIDKFIEYMDSERRHIEKTCSTCRYGINNDWGDIDRCYRCHYDGRAGGNTEWKPKQTENTGTKKRGRKPMVAPVQQEPEVKSVEFIKPEWTEEQKRDIQMIKDAHKAKRAKMKAIAETPKKKGRTRNDIDNSLIVYMIDEQNRKPKDIAKELGCCLQTVMNRYHRGKRDAGGK